MSPAFHRIHHSHDDAHRDRNFSNLFVIWDRLFGTYAGIRDVPSGYGVASEPNPFGLFYGVTAPVKGWYQLAHERFVRSQVIPS